MATSVTSPEALFDRFELRHHEPGIRRQVQLLHARDDFVTQLGIEMHAVGLEQLFGCRVVALGLDALDLGQQPADAVPECLRIGHDVVGLAVARPHLDRLGVGHQPPHDHLAIAHVVFLDLRPLADPAQLTRARFSRRTRTRCARSRPDRPPPGYRSPPASDRAGNTGRRGRRALLRAPRTVPSTAPPDCP